MDTPTFIVDAVSLQLQNIAYSAISSQNPIVLISIPSTVEPLWKTITASTPIPEGLKSAFSTEGEWADLLAGIRILVHPAASDSDFIIRPVFEAEAERQMIEKYIKDHDLVERFNSIGLAPKYEDFRRVIIDFHFQQMMLDDDLDFEEEFGSEIRRLAESEHS